MMIVNSSDLIRGFSLEKSTTQRAGRAAGATELRVPEALIQGIHGAALIRPTEAPAAEIPDCLKHQSTDSLAIECFQLT
jgi:hypothetical protein